MAKLSRKKGVTSQILHVFIQDSSSTVGAGLTGLVFNSASLACRYINAGGVLSGAITLEDITTLGTYQAPTANTNMRFKEVSSASPSQGVYELHIHNDWMNLTGGSLVIMLAGATNMAQSRLEIDLQADVNITHLLGTAWLAPGTAGTPDVNAKLWNGLATVALPLVPATPGRTLVVDPAGLADANMVKAGPTGAGTAQTAGDIMADTNDIQARLPAALTANGNMKSSLVEILTTALTETAGQIAAAFKQFFDVGTPTGTMKAITNVVTATNLTTNNDKTDYALSTAGIQAIWDALTSALTTVGSIGKKLSDWVIGTAQTGDCFARLGAPTGASVSVDIAAIKSETASIQADTDNIQTRIPAALVGGRMDANVGSAEANVITAASIADGAIDAATFAAGAINAAAVATDALGSLELSADAVNEIADGLLDRNMATGVDSGSPTVRTPRQALRGIRNKASIAGGTLTVTKEDDTTPSWTAAVTTTPGDPVSSVDPA